MSAAGKTLEVPNREIKIVGAALVAAFRAGKSTPFGAVNPPFQIPNRRFPANTLTNCA